MNTELKEPTQLVAGMSHKEMLEIMASNNIFCGHDRFARILIDAQRRALADHARRSLARDAMAENERELGLDYMEAAK
jgi:hypothetical protein